MLLTRGRRAAEPAGYVNEACLRRLNASRNNTSHPDASRAIWLKGMYMETGNAALVGYTFVRHVGFILDELSSQGLDL
jgi:hypothetical protein